MFGHNNMTDDKLISERVSNLLNYVQHHQDGYRKNALKQYINEALNRINRINKITGENHAYVFISQLEKALGFEYKNSKLVIGEKSVYREFFYHQFKTQNQKSSVIDDNHFKAFLTDKIPFLSSNGPIAEAEDIKKCEAYVNARKELLLSRQNHYVQIALNAYIKSQMTKLQKAWEAIDIKPEEIIDIKIEFFNRLNKFNFFSLYTKTGYASNNDQKFNRKKSDDGLNIFIDDACEYKDFSEKVSKAISFESPQSFIAKVLNLSERKSQLIKSVYKVKNSILDGYANQNKKDILDQFESDMQTLEAKIGSQSVDFISAATVVKNQLSTMFSSIRKKEEDYYNNDITLFRGYRHSNSSLQPRIDTASKIFASEVLCTLDANERIKEIVNEIKSIIKSYSGSSKAYIVRDFDQSIAQLELKYFGMDKKKKMVEDDAATLKQEMGGILNAIQKQEYKHYDGKKFFQDYQRSNSSFQPKITAAKELVGNIQFVAHRVTAGKG